MKPEWDKYVSPKDHKRRASGLKRLATGLRAEIIAKRTNGLSDKEAKILADAEGLLKELANLRLQAKKDTELRVKARSQRMEEINKCASDFFGKLVSVQDQVALIAGVNKSAVRYILNMDCLEKQFKEALSDIGWHLVDQPGTPKELVTGLWAKFEGKKSPYLEAHADLIVKLLDEKKQ